MNNSKKVAKRYNQSKSRKQGKKTSHNYQDETMVREKLKGEREESEAYSGRGEGKFPCPKVTKLTNHPSWHFKDKAILEDVASFSYMNPLGSDLHVDRLVSSVNLNASGDLTSIPGLLAVTVGITPGVAVDAQDPLNLAAQNVYSYVRYKNSGASNYDAPDLMLYLIALDSAYAMWNWMKRVYGTASTYSATNRYKPKAYAAANYIDLDDIYAHLADMRAYLNMAADRISAFCIPATMTFMVMHSWAFTNVFMDSNTRKAQEYMYVPAYFYVYDETTSPNGGKLDAINACMTAPSKPYTFNDLRNMMDNLINCLSYSEDIGIMSGDILKAYGEGNLFKLGHIDPDYRIDAVYDEQVLAQIENIRIADMFTDLTKFTISQDPNTNYLKFQPTATIAAGINFVSRKGHYLNFHFDNPTPENVIDATRFTYAAAAAGNSIKLTSCGSTLATGVRIFYYAQSQNTAAVYVPGDPLKLCEIKMPRHIQFPSTLAYSLLYDIMRQIWLWTAFDWAPVPELSILSTDGTKVIMLPGLRDWDLYTVISESNIEAMNSLALLSEFNIPN